MRKEEVVIVENKPSLETYRHSVSHIMAQAVKRIYPQAKLGIGPPIEDGFYYDFDLKSPITLEDLIKIEEKMKEIISEDLAFKKREVTKEEAIKLFKKKEENYKLEILSDISEEKVTLYQQGDFIDLCRGPHISSTGEVQAFKLLKVSGAYWRGDEKRQMLQRIYGTAFFTEGELKEHLSKLEEAKKRDHRILGKKLDLFSIQEEGGPGLIYWHPKGALIRKIIEDFWIKEHLKRDYQLVNIPHIAKINLWETSGHLDFYQEFMYSPLEIEGQKYLLKPMNCPGHILIYKSQIHSYRDLPVRYAELGTVYRYERSGVLHGLLRVRGFTQDDAHIFCTPEQLKDEMMKAVELAFFMLRTFGFKDYQVDLSTRPEKFAGTIEDWERAEDTLSKALEERNISYEIDSGGAVFYGPKIDIKMKDALGRLWQGPTIQFDFNLPERFNVTYVGDDGKPHKVVMVHRAVLGSMERFMGTLIEHYAGAFPVWLSPLQIIILPIADRHLSYAQSLREELQKEELRVKVDSRNEKVGFKIREAEMEKLPYMLIVGDKEVEGKTISVRNREKGDLGVMNLDKFKKRVLEEVRRKV
ncbi:MAG: threonine--tRNA ligase [Armatimonadetes bacterium CG07_land_8_20_14_0_80_40_9]|nr:MAG: threonine--tRNA ligase [Armatimonadetes bacterium CG07_land_8_20_14_0_80_40_9]